jgi:DNA primase
LYDDGEEPRLYNASATLKSAPFIFITEGEIDTIAVQAITGYPACAVPGAQQWAKNRYWARCFAPFPLVIMPADGDKAGKDMARAIAVDVPQLRIVHMPSGMDANDVLRTEGAEAFLLRCDLDDWIDSDSQAVDVEQPAADPRGPAE